MCSGKEVVFQLLPYLACPLSSQVYAWHTKTADPDLKHEWYMKSSSQVEYR